MMKKTRLQSALSLRCTHVGTRICPAPCYSTSYKMVGFQAVPAHRDILQQAASGSIWVRMCLHLVFHINIVIWPTLSKKQILTPKTEQCIIINICQNRWGPCEHRNILKSNEEPQAWEFIDYNIPWKDGKKPNIVMTKTPRNLSSEYLLWISR